MSVAGLPVALALGSNIGDRLGVLQGAVDDLAATPGLVLTGASDVVETDPVGGPEQADYLNAVVVGVTSLAPDALLAATQAVEQAWHRTREVRWGPRTLDIDILALGDAVIDLPDLQVPHPRAHERGFVLVPWLSADPLAFVPGHGRASDLVERVDITGVRPTPHRLHLPGVRS